LFFQPPDGTAVAVERPRHHCVVFFFSSLSHSLSLSPSLSLSLLLSLSLSLSLSFFGARGRGSYFSLLLSCICMRLRLPIISAVSDAFPPFFKTTINWHQEKRRRIVLHGRRGATGYGCIKRRQLQILCNMPSF
jgi:hypothetical protein